jgi:hypothetical protein
MAHALRELEKKVTPFKWKLKILGPKPGPQASKAAKAGREVQLRLRRSNASPQDALNASWSFMVPLGFTPWARFPVLLQEDGEEINFTYHFLGPWQSLIDTLLAEGRGHLAWPNFEAAALADVGQDTTERSTERFVQAQLHRLGKNPGPVDGVIGPRTKQEIDSLALGRKSLAQLAALLGEMKSPRNQKTDHIGHISVPGRSFVVNAAGGIALKRHASGAALEITSPGRVILDIGEPNGK